MFRLDTMDGVHHLRQAAEQVEAELNLSSSWDLEVKDSFDAVVEEAEIAILEGIGSQELNTMLDALSQRHPFAHAEAAIERLIKKLEE